MRLAPLLLAALCLCGPLRGQGGPASTTYPVPFASPPVPRRIPLPETTPFDGHPARRRVYLQEYRAGYLRTCGGTMIFRVYNGRPPFPAPQQGQIDGEYAGSLAYLRWANQDLKRFARANSLR